ncbi:hypothetical protein [Bacillus licheniformis]
MKLEKTEPCKDCPFIKGSSTNVTLSRERIQGIVDDIRYNDCSFTCHKTLDLPKNKQQHCAGAMIFLWKDNNPNQIMRIYGRLGMFDPDKLNMNADIIDDY